MTNKRKKQMVIEDRLSDCQCLKRRLITLTVIVLILYGLLIYSIL